MLVFVFVFASLYLQGGSHTCIYMGDLTAAPPQVAGVSALS